MEPTVTLTNPDKVLYPATGTTKKQVFDYYTKIAPILLPHLAGRPVTRKVWPNGVEQPMFFSKDTGRGTPDWIHRVPIEHQNSTKEYPLLDSPAALQWDAQTAGLEIHVPQWHITKTGQQSPPDRMVIDLDPGDGIGLKECAKVALLVKHIIEGMGLELYPCTSGSKGIHLYAPINRDPKQKPLSSDQVSAIAKELAQHLEADYPDLVISTMSKAARAGKVMVDWSQNNGKKTTISPYSLRGVAQPNVVAPRTWKEIASPNLKQLDYQQVLRRVATKGDLLAGLLRDSASAALPRLAQNDEVGRSATRDTGARSAKHDDFGLLRDSASAALPRLAQNDEVGRSATHDPGARAVQNDGNSRAIGAPEPMLATMATKGELAMLEADGTSAHPKWRFEMKWDGYRVIAIVTESKSGHPQVQLRSRNHQDYTERYPELQCLANQVGNQFPVVLDGEIVALTKSGTPSFRDLQTHAVPVSVQVFDILQLGPKDLTGEPFTKRREILEQVLHEQGPVHISPELPYQDAINISHQYQLEGVMAKRAEAKYQPGIRSKDWLKIKHLQADEFIIVGWKPLHQGEPNENPNAVGSILLARQTGNGKLQSVGRVGTGFTGKMRSDLQQQFAKIATPQPIPGLTGITKAEGMGAHWVKPTLRGQVEFAEWTPSDPDDANARLRHPRWRGLVG